MAQHIYMILHSHNTKRNQIAGGRLFGYLPARRMATMQWDSELASIAKLNVEQCAMQHDSCRNTDAFNNAGQSLGVFGYSGPKSGYSTTWLIQNRIDKWWNENKHCKIDYIKN